MTDGETFGRPVLDIAGLEKAFGSNRVLKSVDMTVAAGERSPPRTDSSRGGLWPESSPARCRRIATLTAPPPRRPAAPRRKVVWKSRFS
ncbi:hypothetical protein [Jiella mangrovi]|uniref:Uncharacterized protein n=1 Tax=Jiella mangrovi TaxID=2821407 RepID=A0ABS4BFW3_9HYPH|nr:hypothetical protein [Jiella mangrovi]MBP0615066.1 hypothetical protein [Jiella mangrovi]